MENFLTIEKHRFGAETENFFQSSKFNSIHLLSTQSLDFTVSLQRYTNTHTINKHSHTNTPQYKAHLCRRGMEPSVRSPTVFTKRARQQYS